MKIFFLDTSVLVKRYVVEPGSSWVIEQCQPALDNLLIISQATLVEAVATFCRKAREQNLQQRIHETERDQNITLFRKDTQRQYVVVPVTSSIYTQAGDLCRTHRLRAYDAVQLACALLIRNKLSELEIQAPVFVSADTELLAIADSVGLSVENPNTV
jgi:predicted nucleic acid-binding protein